MKYLAVLLLLTAAAFGQSTIIPFPGVPSGNCAPTKLGLDLANGHLYACNVNSWLEVGPGAAGSADWSTLTSGTNAGQTLLIGAAGTLGTTNGGAINATLLNSKTFASPAAIGTGTPAAITGTTITANTGFSGDGASVTNVNAAQLLSKTWASPAAIGTGTPAAITGTTITANSSFVGNLTGNVTGNVTGALTGNASTATALASAPTKCSAGNYPLGIDVNGNAQNCTATGVGTVTVVGAGSLTSTAITTGGGTTTLQTPSATTTLDSSGNISTPGTMASGVGSGIAGGYVFTNGTANSIVANSFLLEAPTTITTGYGWSFPAGENASAGVVHAGAASSHKSALTISAVIESDLSFTNVTTANASITKHGLLPILDGDVSHCFLGDGTFGTCGSGGGNVSNTGTPTSGQAAEWTNATTIQGVAVVGTGSYVKATSTTLVTPALGVATATSINKVAITAPGSSATLTIADGKTLTASNTLTFTGTDSSSVAFGGGGTVLYNGGALGTPSSATLTNATGLPGAGIVSASVTATQLAAQYSKGSCTEVWGGSGTSFAMTSGDDLIVKNGCYNDSGVTRTITAVKCRSDNAGNTTVLTPTFGSAGTGTAILTGTLTCGNSYAFSSTGTLNNTAWTTGTGIAPGMSTVGNATSIAMIVEYTF